MMPSVKARERALNIVIAFLSLIFFLVSLEIIFRGIPKSHGVGYTLAAQLWNKKYFKPINANGFRDDPIPPDVLNKKLAVVLGASIVVGDGIKDAENRFSNLLKQKLHSDARLLNFGVPGKETLGQIDLISGFPRWPDVLILFYGPNDIEGRAKNEGLSFAGFTPYQDLSPWAAFWVTRSYFLNYIYWLFPHGDVSGYLDFLQTAYSNQEVFKKHLQDLQFFIERSRKEKAPLYVIIFPAMWDREGYRPYLKSVDDFFAGQGAHVLNVAESTSKRAVRDLIISVQDAHPSEKMNKIVFDQFWDLYGGDFMKLMGNDKSGDG